jgi:hypothetical protein
MNISFDTLNQLTKEQQKFILEAGAQHCTAVKLKRNFKEILQHALGYDDVRIADFDKFATDRYYIAAKTGDKYTICGFDRKCVFVYDAFEHIEDNPKPSLFKTRERRDRKTEAYNKRMERRDVFTQLYEDGDSVESMTSKMRENGYPNISQPVVYKVACECGIKVGKPKNAYEYGGKYRGRYKTAYDIYGRRTMVRVDKIDNVNFFSSKKMYNEMRNEL